MQALNAGLTHSRVCSSCWELGAPKSAAMVSSSYSCLSRLDRFLCICFSCSLLIFVLWRRSDLTFFGETQRDAAQGPVRFVLVLYTFWVGVCADMHTSTRFLRKAPG